MKTSNFTQVEALLKAIEKINQEHAELGKCNAIVATADNYQEGQIRLLLSTSDAIGSRVRNAWANVLHERKLSYIDQLKQYHVEYDGK